MVKRSSAVRIGGCQCPRDGAASPIAFQSSWVMDWGDAFRAVRVGGFQCPALIMRKVCVTQMRQNYFAFVAETSTFALFGSRGFARVALREHTLGHSVTD